LLLGIFLPYVICVVTYMILRSFAGGYHCKTFKQCYFTSNILYLLLVALGLTFSYNSWLLLGIALIPSVGIIPLCPKPSEYSISQGKIRDKRFRAKYIVSLAILTAIAVGLIVLGYSVYANMIACGMIGTVIMVTDCCSSIISQIWKLIDGE
jgi:accessory gene regulator B